MTAIALKLQITQLNREEQTPNVPLVHSEHLYCGHLEDYDWC